MKKKILACTLACLGGLAVFTTESAARAADFAPAFMTSRAGGFIDVWPAKDVVGMWFGAELQFRVARQVFLDFSISGAYVEDSRFGRFKHAAYGNPTAGAHYADQITPKLALYAGGTLTLPILHDPDNQVTAAAYDVLPMRGYYDADRFWPGRMALRGMVGIEWQMARRWYLRADGRLVVSIQTLRRNDLLATSDDAYALFEHDAEVEYRLDNGLGFGARLQGVLIPQANDVYQAMAEPFLMLTPRSRGLYLRLGFPIALDRELGFGFDDNKVATIRFAIGGQW